MTKQQERERKEFLRKKYSVELITKYTEFVNNYQVLGSYMETAWEKGLLFLHFLELSNFNSFEQLAQQHIDFGKKIFPNSTVKSCFIHAGKEFGEVLKESDGSDKQLTEFADVFLCCISALGKAGFTPAQLLEAIEEKIKINQLREWKQNPDGTYSHVKTNTMKRKSNVPSIWYFILGGILVGLIFSILFDTMFWISLIRDLFR